MKKIFAALMLSVVALVAFAQTESPTAPAQGPVIYFEQTVHDFGAITKGADGTHQFTFVNNGNAPLILSNASSSCGCTVPSFPKTPVAPGDSAVVTVKYDTNRMGGFHKNVTVSSNATNGAVVLYIKGSVN